MKVCVCIAEYNPFHFGHLKHIEYIKNDLKAEKIVVVMSGNFTQRGEPAVMNKYIRAKHAIMAGASMVIELPTVFATANAETFAKGAIRLIKGLNVADGICFGIESGNKEEYLSLARAMNDESKAFKKALKDNLDKGYSLAKAKFESVKAINDGNFNESLISSPNNILGLEYVKAILDSGLDIEICPLIRDGDHNDENLKKGITSATSIRQTLKADQKRKLKKSIPKFVYDDLKEYPYSFDKMIMTSLLTASKQTLSEIPDCTEGLENRIKALAKDNFTVETLIQKVSTKRYPITRISRILINNLLKIDNDLVKECLENPLYAKVLAVSNDDKNLISTATKTSSIPLITRKSDILRLKRSAEKCFEVDVLSTDLYNLAMNEKSNEYQTLFI